MKADVYFNLHKRIWSVRNLISKLVERHEQHISMQKVMFVVSEAGRQRVLKERRKNVHAFVRGKLTSFRPKSNVWLGNQGYRQAYYNPYKVSTFVDKDTGCMLLGNYSVYMRAKDKSVWYKSTHKGM